MNFGKEKNTVRKKSREYISELKKSKDYGLIKIIESPEKYTGIIKN